MKVIALTIESEKKWVEKLCAELGWPVYTHVGQRIESFNNSVIVRFGNSGLFYNKIGKQEEFKNVINSSKKIRRNCCKLVAARKMGRVIDVPKFFVRNIPANKTVINRPIYHACAGADFALLKTKQKTKIQHGYYASQFIRTSREWRVFYVRINNKINVLGAIRFKDKKDLPKLCRSNWAYKFRKVPKKLIEHVLFGSKALELEFGCADVLQGRDGKYYTCEHNTCPNFETKKIRAFYKENLNKLIKLKFKNIKLEKEKKIDISTVFEYFKSKKKMKQIEKKQVVNPNSYYKFVVGGVLVNSI